MEYIAHFIVVISFKWLRFIIVYNSFTVLLFFIMFSRFKKITGYSSTVFKSAFVHLRECYTAGQAQTDGKTWSFLFFPEFCLNLFDNTNVHWNRNIWRRVMLWNVLTSVKVIMSSACWPEQFVVSFKILLKYLPYHAAHLFKQLFKRELVSTCEALWKVYIFVIHVVCLII